MTDNPRLAAALEYAQSGYSVIPVLAGDKKPLSEWKEFQQRRATTEEIQGWWEKYPRSNVGIVCGPISGLTVIDLDGREGLESVRKLNLPKTRVVKTPHGHHLYYAHTPDLHTGAGFLPGIDVRNDGGFVVAPPSEVHGTPYTVLQSREVVPIGPIPQELLNRQRNGSRPSESAPTHPSWVSDLLTHGATEGSRNNDAIRLAGYLHGKGHPVDVIMAMMNTFARRCTPPMDDAELRATIRSVLRYPQKQAVIRVEGAPDMEDLGSHLVFRWPAHNLLLSMSNLRWDHEDLRSLLNLYREGPEGNLTWLYGPAKYNIIGTQDRSGLVRYLKETLNLDAAQMLQGMGQLAYQHMTRGTPTVYLADVEPRTKSDTWALYPLIIYEHVNVWFGDGGTGKSLLALLASMSLHTGENLGLGKPLKPLPAMYLDWEFDAKDHRVRMLRIAQGDASLADTTLMYKRCWMPLWEMTDELLRETAEHGIGFWVVDSALMACGGEPEKADIVRRVFEAMRRIGGTWLIIAHSTHDKERDSPFGSRYWYHTARNIWKFNLAHELGADTTHVMLKHTKVNSGRKERPIGLRIDWGERIRLEREDPAEVEEHAKRISVADRVWAALESGPMSYQDLLDTLAVMDDTITYATVANAVKRGEGKRFTLAVREGKKVVSRIPIQS
jgi:hypothetical protein